MTDAPRGPTTEAPDNFDRHVWEMIGASAGVGLTAFFGWVVGLGWLIGYGLGGFLLWGLLTGRIVLQRRKSVSGRA